MEDLYKLAKEIYENIPRQIEDKKQEIAFLKKRYKKLRKYLIQAGIITKED